MWPALQKDLMHTSKFSTLKLCNLACIWSTVLKFVNETFPSLCLWEKNFQFYSLLTNEVMPCQSCKIGYMQKTSFHKFGHICSCQWVAIATIMHWVNAMSIPEQMLQKITGLLNVPQQLVLMCHSSHSCMLGMQCGCLHYQQCSHPVWAGHWSMHVQYHVEWHNQKWSPTLNPWRVYWSYWLTKHWVRCLKFWIDSSVHHLTRSPYSSYCCPDII